MPRFGESSQQNLNECIAELQEVAHVAIQLTDFGIITGHRGEAAQNEKYDKGLSTVQYPDSKHNKVPSQAFDFAPYHPSLGYLFGGEDQLKEITQIFGLTEREAERWVQKQYSYQAGIIMGAGKALNIKLRWGGDWSSDGYTYDNGFDDLGHIEVVG